ncbi:MAG: DUF4345 domain-containing protein [Gammaproteobacteria bacterium]
MDLTHKFVLYAALGFLGVSLILPGLYEIIKNIPDNGPSTPVSSDAKNQLRALNGMMMGVGIMALWTCFYLEQSRSLIIVLGYILLMVAAARIYSVVVDGLPSAMTWSYLAIELVLGSLFLMWPPSQ